MKRKVYLHENLLELENEFNSCNQIIFDYMEKASELGLSSCVDDMYELHIYDMNIGTDGLYMQIAEWEE